MELPDSRIWLEEKLKERGLSMNSLAEQVGMAASAVHSFAEGTAGPQTCLNIARGLNASPLTTLALCGHIPAPAHEIEHMANELNHTLKILNAEGRERLMEYASWLKGKYSSSE